MSYISFQMKKILKNKFTYVPMIIIFALCFFSLFQNYRAGQEVNLGNDIRENIQRNSLMIESAQEKLASVKQGSQEYNDYKKLIEDSKEILKYDKEFLQQYNNHEWNDVYEKQIHNIKKALSASKRNPDSRLIDALNRELSLYYTLKSEKIAFEDSNYPVTGIQYTMSMFLYIFPILFIIGITFIFGNLFTSSFYNKLNISNLLPLNQYVRIIYQIITGYILTLIIFLINVFLIFGVSSILFGSGNYNYPILHFNLENKKWYFSAIGPTVWPSIFLFCLSLLFVISFIYLISFLFKDKMISLFVSSLLLIGGILLPYIIEPIRSVSKFLPTTYLHSYEIFTGVYQNKIENYQINGLTGFVVVAVYIVIILLLIVVINFVRNSKIIEIADDK